MNQDIFKQIPWMAQWGNSLLRRKFICKNNPESAKLFVVCDHHTYAREAWQDSEKCDSWLLGGSFLKYRIFINGEMIGAGPFRQIEDKNVVMHQFDLTKFLQTGENILALQLRTEKRGVKILLQIDDETITSDTEFLQLRTDNCFPSSCWRHQEITQFFKGGSSPGEWPEHIDGTLFPQNWNLLNFNDELWSKVKLEQDSGEFIEDCGTDNYQLSVITAYSCRKTGKSLILDFQRECVGSIILTIDGQRDVEIRLGEELLESGRVRFQMRSSMCCQEIWSFPSGKNTLENFGLRAFRYVELINVPDDFDYLNLKVRLCIRHFDESQSFFNSSNKNLNSIWQLCKNTIRDTNLDVYVDCPSRERIAYEADSYFAMLSHFALEYNIAPAKRTLAYQINHLTWPQEWRSFIVPLFLKYYIHSGDLTFILKYYERLKDFAAESSLTQQFTTRVIIDWPNSCRDDYEFGPYNSVPNSFVYWSITSFAELAQLLGKTSDAQDALKRAEKIKKEFQQRLIDNENGLCRDNAGSQHFSLHATLFAVCFDLMPEIHLEKALNFIEKKGMKCSVYASSFLLDALAKHHRISSTFQLMTASNDTSWLGMINQGAICTMEAWNPIQKPNTTFAHPWATGPVPIISKYLFGIEIIAPGWKKIKVNPAGHFDFEAKIPTPKGALFITRKSDKTQIKLPNGIELI